MDHIDLTPYFAGGKGCKTGHPRCDAEKLLKVILFAFMEKYMKFTMFEKETKNKKYQNDPYRIVNFKQNENGELICPNGKRFIHKCDKHVYKNKYGRTEEIYECEDCDGCPYRGECCRKKEGNRTARLNRELTLISFGFNLYKYHNKKWRNRLSA